LNEDIKQKNVPIVERGLKIKSVKKDNQDLDKHHQVLNHRENDLHHQTSIDVVSLIFSHFSL
jgi:hypothetical protein